MKPRHALGWLLLVPLWTGCTLVSGQSDVPEFADVAPYVGPPTAVVPVDAVVVPLGVDVPAFVAGRPAGTTFVFETGVHRLERAIAPRDGDAFVGRDGAVLSGAVPVADWAFDGGRWVAQGYALDGRPHGTCRAATPACNLPEDLFLDDRVLRRVVRVGDVRPGSWAFDTDAERLVMGDDPSGRRVELSRAGGAIVGDADDVTVANLVVERFANGAQRGAIFAERVASEVTLGERWTIVGNEVRQNHGVGIRAGSGAWIVDNFVHGNGQLGVASYGTGPTRVEANEIAGNNVAGYDPGWEAGGTKFVRTDGLVVRHNFVHGNDGPGLWTDIDNVRTLVEHNRVVGNADSGIFHEISYAAVIRHNVVLGNGAGRGRDGYAYAYGAGILIADSRDVLVYGNRVESNWNGIVGLDQGRGAGALGPYVLRGLVVRDNDVSLPFHEDGVGPQGERGVPAFSGVVASAGRGAVFGALAGNRFVGNRTTVEDQGRRHFAWADGPRDFASFQRCRGSGDAWPGCRQEVGGTLLRGPVPGPEAISVR